MCTMSAVSDNWNNQFPNKWPDLIPSPNVVPVDLTGIVKDAEIARLKKEVEELKKLLLAAKEFDIATGQPHCEMSEKIALIKAVAKTVGVDMSDVFLDYIKE